MYLLLLLSSIYVLLCFISQLGRTQYPTAAAGELLDLVAKKNMFMLIYNLLVIHRRENVKKTNSDDKFC